MSQSAVVLYHAPPSFYSQIARLVLAEKGVEYERRFVVPGPPSFETYAPWYMRLNPGGTVPTLVVGDEVVCDSRAILHAVDAHFDGPVLTPGEQEARDEMERWIAKAYELPARVLAYGSKRVRRIGAWANEARRRVLVRRREKHADLRDAYDAKIADIDRFIANSQDEAYVAEVAARYDAALDELDAHLSDRDTICDEVYSLADVVWTVVVARQHMLGRAPLEHRPALARWYAQMKGRPSFRAADLWERFRPGRMLLAMAGKFKWHLLMAGLVLVAATALLCGVLQ